MEENKPLNLKGFKIFVIVLMIITIFFLKEENRIKFMSMIEGFNKQKLELKSVQSINLNGNVQNIKLYDDTISIYEKNKIKLLKLDGSLKVEKDFKFEEPYIYYGEEKIYMIDKSTGDIYYIDKDGKTLQRFKLKGDIIGLRELDKNLICHIKNGDKENIKILDEKGIIIDEYSFDDSILTYDIDMKNNMKSVAVLDTDSNLTSRISIYGQGKEVIGNIEIEDQIIMYLQIIGKNRVIIFSEDSIYLIDNNNIAWKKNFDKIKDLYIKNGRIYILYDNILEIIDYKGIVKDKYKLNNHYKKIGLFKDELLLFNDKILTILDNGKEIISYEGNIKSISISEENILIEGESHIGIYKIYYENK